MLKSGDRTSQAGNLVPAVGGGDYAHLLLPLLEALAEKEETLVRAKVQTVYILVSMSLYLPHFDFWVANRLHCLFCNYQKFSLVLS